MAKYFVTIYDKNGVSISEEHNSPFEALMRLSELWREYGPSHPELSGFLSGDNFNTIGIVDKGRYRNLLAKEPIELTMLREAA